MAANNNDNGHPIIPPVNPFAPLLNAVNDARNEWDQIRQDLANLRRGRALRGYHFHRVRHSNVIQDRAHQLEIEYHREVHRLTFHPTVDEGQVTRIATTRAARTVYANFMRFNRLRDDNDLDQILDLFIGNISRVRHFSEDELDYICGLTNAWPIEPLPAPVAP